MKYEVTLSLLDDSALIGLQPDGATWRWEIGTIPLPQIVIDDDVVCMTLAMSYLMACIGAANDPIAAAWVFLMARPDYSKDQLVSHLSELHRLLGDDAEGLMNCFYERVTGESGNYTTEKLDKALAELEAQIKQGFVSATAIQEGRA